MRDWENKKKKNNEQNTHYKQLLTVHTGSKNKYIWLFVLYLVPTKISLNYNVCIYYILIGSRWNPERQSAIGTKYLLIFNR